jgi:hypothetical protein
MKQVLIILVLLMISAHIAAAESSDSLNPVEIMTNAVASGIEVFIKNQMDSLYSSLGTNETNANEYALFIMKQKNDFLQNEGVKKVKGFTAFWYFIIYVLFIFVGGIQVMREAADSSSFGNDNGSWRNQYIEIAVFAPLIWAFYLYGLQWLFSLEWVLTSSAYIETNDIIVYIPSNIVYYTIFAVVNVSLIMAMYIRYLIVGMVSAFFLLIVAATLLPFTRNAGIMLLSYGGVMLFSRFIMSLILTAGMSIMMPFSAAFPLVYLVVVFVAFVFASTCIFYPILAPFMSPLRFMIIKKTFR